MIREKAQYKVACVVLNCVTNLVAAVRCLRDRAEFTSLMLRTSRRTVYHVAALSDRRPRKAATEITQIRCGRDLFINAQHLPSDCARITGPSGN